MPVKDPDPSTFEQAAQGARPSLVREFWDFLKHNKKWWLLPILVALALAALIVVLGSIPSLAPFIYPLF